MYALAGPASDVLFGYARGTWRGSRRAASTHVEDDRRAARELAATLSEPDTIEHLWNLTARLVRLQRATVERVASALLQRETLTGDEVRELLRAES